MHWNQYTKIIPINEDNVALFNYVNDTSLILSRELFRVIEPLLRNNDFASIEVKHPQLYMSLLENGFVTAELLDSNWMFSQLHKKLSSKKVYRLTVNPTLDCNLRCWYCYQSHTQNCYMSDETQDAVLKFAESKISCTELETFRLSFFGGEPLLKARSIAIPLAEKIHTRCKKHNKKLLMHFTTNGVLLSEPTLLKLKSICENTTLQIPFDGGRDLHNNTKKNSKGLGMYDKTLNNIFTAVNYGFHINIRCNYTLQNIASFEELIYDVRANTKGREHLVSFSLQKVWQEENSIELAKRVQRIRDVIHQGPNEINDTNNGIAPSFCYADYEESMLINYDGSLYKCTARDFTPENKIGDLAPNGSIVMHSYKYAIDNRYNNDCKTCSILPICTICTQARQESTDKAHCPVVISEADKQRQIVTRFQTIYGRTLM